LRDKGLLAAPAEEMYGLIEDLP